MSFAPRWHVIFHDRENVVPGGFASYRLCQRETSVQVRQVFMAGPDDKRRGSTPRELARS